MNRWRVPTRSTAASNSAERNTDLPRDLRGGFASHILLLGEDGYDRARAVWNAMVDRRPAIIARRTSGSERKTG
jgi:hypothetical protein